MQGGHRAPSGSVDGPYRWFVAACALSLTGLVVGLVGRAMGAGGLVRFGLPALAAPLATRTMMASLPPGRKKCCTA